MTKKSLKVRLSVISVGAASIVAVAGLALAGDDIKTVRTDATFANYTSAEQMTTEATDVVQAKFTGKTRVVEIGPSAPAPGADEKSNPSLNAPSADVPNDKIVYTVYEMRAQKVFKGTLKPGQTFEVKQMGGLVGKVRYMPEESAPLDQGNSSLLFMVSFPDAPASILNPTQGLYRVDDTGAARALPGNSVAAPPGLVKQLLPAAARQ